MDDYDIIQTCLSGKGQAFGQLVRRYQAEAIGHAVGLLGNLPDALDVVQEAFLAAFQALDRFDAPRKFYPWFYTILRNRCYKELIRQKKHAAQSVATVQWLETAEDSESPQKTALVQQALLGLNTEDRELLTLKHIDGLTYKELAERLDIPTGTVMSRLYHARCRFRSRYQKQLESSL